MMDNIYDINYKYTIKSINIYMAIAVIFPVFFVSLFFSKVLLEEKFQSTCP